MIKMEEECDNYKEEIDKKESDAYQILAEDIKKRAKVNDDGSISLVGINDEVKITKKIKKIVESFYSKQDLVSQLLELQPLYYDENKIWWFWETNDFRWKITDETNILNFVSKLSTADTINSKERTEILESIRQLSRLNKPKEMEKTWIQFKEDLVDITTGEEFKASSKYFITNPIPYSLNKDRFIDTPNMDRIFEEWVGKENVQSYMKYWHIV